VPQDVHLEQTILGRREPGAELGVRTSPSEDVGHPEFLLAQDHGPVVRRGEGLDPFGL
jgi:hypothetical protein